MEKGAVPRILEEIALLLELKGENPFKSRAYYNAARTVELLGEEQLHALVLEDKLKEVKGIGSALNDKLKELVLTGSLKYYEELRESVPAGLRDLLAVPGLGPRKARALYDALGIDSLAELEYACKENRLVNLKGFGPKTQENILKGIEYLRRFQGRYYYREARKLAGALLDEIKNFPALGEVSLAGSIRRCREIVKDIDLVASADNPEELTGCFAGLPQVAEVVARGGTKATVRLHEGILADLRVVRGEEFPCALHHFTGSKEHNTALRHRAKTMGLKINEYGVFKGEAAVSCRDEEELFQALNLAYIPPELRENFGEIEAAEKGTLPLLVEEKDIKGIFHVHTVYSDGENTLEEIVRFCREAGFEYVGISDHSRSAYYARGLSEEDLLRQLEEIEALKKRYPDMAIFSGVESDIRADGSLDYADEILQRLDFVIASVHSGFKMPLEKMTERVVRALSHPLVTMLGHPTGRLLLGREGYPLNLDKVLQTALEHNVIVELNASPARLDLDWRHLKSAKEMGLLISINPDAHRLKEFADVYLGVGAARKGWLEKEDVFNTRPRREVEAYLRSRKSRIS